MINVVPNMVEQIARSQNVQGFEGIIKCFCLYLKSNGKWHEAKGQVRDDTQFLVWPSEWLIQDSLRLEH